MSGMQQARVAPSVAVGWWETEAFRVFAACAPVGVMVVGPDGRLLYVNDRWVEITGLATPDASGLVWLRRIHPADRRTVIASARRVARSVCPVEVECRVRRPTGETVWVRGRCMPARSGGGLVGYAVWVEDVTAEREARAKVERLSLVLERSTDFVTIIDLSGRLLYANETVRRFFGVETGADVRRLPRGLGFTEASQRRLDEEAVPALRRDGVWTGELVLVGPDGAQVHVLQSSRLHRDGDGRPEFVAGVGRDISQLKAAERHLAASEARFRSLAEHSHDLVAIVDTAGRFVFASPSHTRVLGYDPATLVGRRAIEFVHPDDVDHLKAVLEDQPPTGNPTGPVEYRHRHHDGGWRHLEAVATAPFDEPSVGGVILNGRDVTNRRRAEQRLAHLALHDPLTGLPNRTQAIDRLQQLVEQSHRNGSTPAVLFLDLDRFKALNDTLGHDAGDQVLVELGRRLRAGLRPGDFIARLGGDEFIFMCEVLDGARSAQRVGERILELVREPFHIKGSRIEITASIGVATLDDSDPDTLVANADSAMYQAKQRGRDRAERFLPETDRSANS